MNSSHVVCARRLLAAESARFTLPANTCTALPHPLPRNPVPAPFNNRECARFYHRCTRLDSYVRSYFEQPVKLYICKKSEELIVIYQFMRRKRAARKSLTFTGTEQRLVLRNSHDNSSHYSRSG